MAEILDEGVYYLTASPTENNGLLKGLNNIKKNRPTGVLAASGFGLIPFKIKFKSVNPVTKERSDNFHKLLRFKINDTIEKTVGELFTTIKSAEKWTDFVVGATVQNHKFNCYIKIDYGEVSSGLWEMFGSIMVGETSKWETKYGYSVDVIREAIDIMLVFETPGEQCLLKINQRLADEKIKVSARQWKVGLSYKKETLWSKPWWDIIKRIVD